MQELTKLFKILSDENRLQILILLYHQELCVCQLTGILELTQPKVSKHLAKLRDLNLVSTERKEQFIFYQLNKQNLLFIDILKWIIQRKKHFPNIENYLENLKSTEIYL